MPRGDKPTTVALALKDGWVYEDALPAMSKEEYDWWYRESLVLDGVRMGPPFPADSHAVERWKKDLHAAGWIAESATAWRAPDGSLIRGPFGAWKELQRRQAMSTSELEKDFDEPHRWEIEPHPWDSNYDIFVTDDDEVAREAILHAAEMHLWDSNDGEERTLRVKMNDKIANVQNTRRAAVAGPRGDARKLARQIIDAVINSPCVVEVRMFSQPDAVEKLEDAIIALLPAATSSPESESPILAFDKWLMRYVADCGKLSQKEYGIAYAAFIAAHPGEGPLARTMNDPTPPERTQVAGEQDVKLRIESIAEPWICVEEKPCEEAVPVHWNEMITALVAAEQRIVAAAPADDDAESLLPELTAVFVTNAIRVHTLSNHGCKWHDCLADVCHNNKELIQRAREE